MKFAELFRIGIRHDFYDNGICPDFRVSPDAATEAILRNHRSLLRPTPNGLICITEVEEDGSAFLPLPEEKRMRFKLVLKNKDFSLFTELTDFSALTAPVFELADGLTLTAVAGQAEHTARLTVVEPAAEESFLLSVNPLAGLTAGDFSIAPGAPAGAVSAYKEAAREIRIDTTAAAAGTTFDLSYAVRPTQPPDAFAEIDLLLRADEIILATPQRPAPEYRITFESKKSRWAYYCVTNLELELADYAVIDEPPEESPGETLVFSQQQKTDLKAEPDERDRVAQRLGRTYPKMRRYRLVSDQPVACQQAVRPGLRLLVEGARLPRQLANPSYRNTTTVSIGSGDDARQFNCLTEVVKLITEPLA